MLRNSIAKLGIIYLLAIVALIPAHAQWTAYSMNIPAAHPRLWLTSARKTAAQTYYNAHPFTPSSTIYFDQAYLHYIALGGGITNYPSGYDCTTAINWALAHVVPVAGTGSDDARNSGEQMILVYDWCYDQLTSQNKTDLQNSINKWITQVASTGWTNIVKSPQSNYFVGYLRNEMEWGIASYGESVNGSGTGSIADSILKSAVGTTANPNVNTKIAAGVGSTGSQTVTPLVFTGIPANCASQSACDFMLLIDAGQTNQELVFVTASTTTTFSATFALTHAANVTVKSTNYCRWYCHMKPWADGSPTYIPISANTNGLGGFLEEGMEYGSSLEALSMPFISANNMGRNILNESQYFKSLAYYVMYETTPAKTFNVKQNNLLLGTISLWRRRKLHQR
jgi:hypothetical protein